MAAAKVKKPRIKWLKTCNHEPFSVECIEGLAGGKPIVFAGEYGFRNERDIQRFLDALEKANKWLAAERKKLYAGGKKK